MSSPQPDRGSSLTSRSSSQYVRRDPWPALEALLQTLTDATSSTRSIQATVQAAADAISADAAFWFSRSVRQPRSPSPGRGRWTRLVRAVRQIVARPPAGRRTTWCVWTNPHPTRRRSRPPPCCAARPRRTGASSPVSFDPDRRFDDGDVKVARFTLKMLLTQRSAGPGRHQATCSSGCSTA